MSMRTCLVKNGKIGLTETFILAHVDTLDASVIHGLPPRLMEPAGRRPSTPARLAARALRRLPVSRGKERAETLEYSSLLKTTGADIVLSEYGTTGVLVWRACEALGLPLVVHFHGYDASREEVLQRHAEEYRRMFDYASAIVVVSRAMREQVLRLGASPATIVLNPCSVDLEAFALGTPDQSAPTFLAVGRLVEKKAPHLLVLAFAEVRKHVPTAKLRIIGDGELRKVVEDLVVGLGLRDAVDLRGAQSHDVVREEMQNARAFVQHSVVASDGDSEGTPVSVLEASASGLPVVSTEHAGIPDAVLNGETGYIVPERDVAGMAARMITLAQQPDRAAQLGRAGRARMEALFGHDLRLGRLQSVMQRVHRGEPLGDDLLVDPLESSDRSAS